MTIKTIQQAIEELAAEDMTEDGIHHDYWTDHEGEYIADIIDRLLEVNEIEK